MTPTVGLVQQFVQRTGQLYSLPAVAAEILRLTEESRIDVPALVKCLQRDPALATRLLRVVNSSLFGLSRPVVDLNQALALLGTRPLKMLVLGFSLPKELFTGLKAEVLSRYWRRSLLKAVAARELAVRLWRETGDEALLAGLVQDIGMLALIQQLGEPYLQLIEFALTQGGGLRARELETLGFDHLVLSARLLTHWGLPQELCTAVGAAADENLIDELPETGRGLARTLHLAELLARLIERPYGPELSELLGSGGRYCGLTYENLRPIVAAMQEQVEELAEVLALELPGGESYVDLLITAQQRLSEEAVHAAAALAAPAAEERLLALTRQMQHELAAAVTHTSLLSPLAAPVAARLDDQATGGRGDRNHRENDPRPHRRIACPIALAPSLAGQVNAAIGRCRQNRCPLTLTLFELDRFSDQLLEQGPARVTETIQRLRAELSEWAGQRAEVIVVSDSCLALIWENCTRSEGVRLARQALASVRPPSGPRTGTSLSLSAGLATLECPPKNYPADELIAAARRCLSAAQLSGGSAVKSIEV